MGIKLLIRDKKKDDASKASIVLHAQHIH